MACYYAATPMARGGRGKSVAGRVLAGLALGLALGGAASAETVSSLEIDGVISPITVRLVSAAIERTRADGGAALVILLDTPGGLERSMRSIVRDMLNSPVPVIVYVSPTGARAASAGAFITIAAHVAAMAPATNIGAAHPVAAGGGAMDKEMTRKVENDAAAFIRTVARERGRNQDWAEKAVRSSVSATEQEALKLGIIDLVAGSLPDLLAKVDGRQVKTVRGMVALRTRGATVQPFAVGWRDRFLALITDPNIAYILLMLGMLGLFFELANPGVILPGVIGGISLILAFFAFQSLPINWAGFLLILFGIVLLIAEIKVVSHGVLTIGGVIAILLGSMMLVNTPELPLRVAWTVIVPVVAVTAGIFMFAVSAGVKAQMSRPTTGTAGLVDEIGVAQTAIDPEGQVMVHGELWTAVPRGAPIAAGERVRVVAVEGLRLHVERAPAGQA
jgi:membrane-bound serine protease (ClpP class)